MKRYMMAGAGACVGLALAGCGGDGEAGNSAAETSSSAASSTSSSAARSTAASSSSAAALGQVDVYTCQSFVADAGDAYGWAKQLQTTGTATSDLSTPGYIAVYQLGWKASLYAEQVESPELGTAMQTIVSEGQALRAAIDAGGGSLDPNPLVDALEEAASICEAGGFVISWH